jgi:hypothetical protein
MKLILKIYFYLGRLLRRRQVVPWEKVSALPEGIPYVVVGLLPTDFLTSHRPLVLSKLQDMKGQAPFYYPAKVDTRLVMATSCALASIYPNRLGLGDTVARVGNGLELKMKKQYDYVSAL